jgi:aspartate kinase
MQVEVCQLDAPGLRCSPAQTRDSDGPISDIIVQPIDASWIDNARGIDDAARRIIAIAKSGKKVVVVVSTPGGMRSHFLSLAQEISVAPDSRELAVLCSTADLIPISLLTMSIINLGHDAISFTGEQAGLITDCAYSRARIVRLAPTRVVEAVKAAKVVIVAGSQGVASDGNITVLEEGDDSTAIALARTLRAEIQEM